MSKIEGRAKRHDGTAIDYVLIFDWVTGKHIDKIIPDAAGVWSYAHHRDLRLGFVYVANGCEPIAHGAYDFVGDNAPLIVNSDFNDGLVGWINNSSYWRWIDGNAYHPLGSTYKDLLQTINYKGNVLITVDITVVQGSAEVFVVGNTAAYFGVGTHRAVINAYSDNSLLGVCRAFDTTSEFYVSRITVERVG